MFEEYLVESRRSGTARNRASVAVSSVIHCSIVVVLVLIPLFQLQLLPQIQSVPPLPPFRMPKAKSVRVVQLLGSPGPVGVHPMPLAPTLTAPSQIPARIEAGPDVGQPDLRSALGFGIRSGGGGGGSLFGLDGGGDLPGVTPPPERPVATLAPPPPAPPRPVSKGPVRLGGGVQEAKLIEQPPPVYPKLAIAARVQGVVVLEAVITKEGNVDSLHVVSGHPLLTQAAIDAVRQWRYRPTLLNGEPVDVVTTVTVNFALR